MGTRLAARWLGKLLRGHLASLWYAGVCPFWLSGDGKTKRERGFHESNQPPPARRQHFFLFTTSLIGFNSRDR